jgi:hypothetical protein
MLERQQSQLVAGVRSMYKKLVDNEGWPGTPLHEQTEGHPLTHDILDRLNVLHMTEDKPESFEEDLETLQRRLLERGAPFVSSSSRKRSSPETAALESTHLTIPSKRRSYNVSGFPQSYQEAWVNTGTEPIESHGPFIDPQLLNCA